MTQSDPNSQTLADAAQLTAADGGGAVDTNTLTLAEMNSYLGKDFKDKESALKAVKDTFSFVGKRKEDIEAEVRASLAPVTSQNASAAQPADTVSKSEFKSLSDELFFTQNPDYKEYRDVIAKMGASPAEVVASAEFKKIFDRVKVADAADSAKSIVSSSPKIAQTKTVVDSAVQIANARGSSVTSVAEALAQGINEMSQGE